MKRSDERRGDVGNALCSQRPEQITKLKGKKVLEVEDKNPTFTFQWITNIVDVRLGHFTIDKILCNSSFHLKISKNKPFRRFG